MNSGKASQNHQYKKQRNRIKEIIDIRGRQLHAESRMELEARLDAIGSAYELTDKGNLELLKYFPVALVACMESVFRLLIKEIIDQGDPYLSNAKNRIDDCKINFDAVYALRNHQVTIGEIVSHSLPMSSFEQFLATLSDILDKDFEKELLNVVDILMVRFLEFPAVPMIARPAETFKYVRKTFELRHIICHEAATKLSLTAEDIESCLLHSISFLRATSECVTQLLYPEPPLSLEEARMETALRFDSSVSHVQACSQAVGVRSYI